MKLFGKKGNAGIGAIMTIVALVATLYVGVLVTDRIDDSVVVSYNNSADAQSKNPLWVTESNLGNNSGGAFDLTSIAPIAAAAGLVIAMLVGWMGNR